MPHIHDKPGQHDSTVSAFVILEKQGQEPKILMHIHKKLHKLLQPGGHVELNETPWQSVCHELAEETGYDIDQLRILQPDVRPGAIGDAVVHPMPAYVLTHGFDDFDHYHTDQGYVFVTNQLPRDDVDNATESTDLRWMSVDEVARTTSDEMPENIRDIVDYVGTQILPNWRAVETSEFRN